MASDVDICNLAVAHLGSKPNIASIDPPEDSPEAEHCARFYPIARDVVLEEHAWRFATRRVVLTALDITILAPGFSYAYALPSGCLRPLTVYDPNAADDQGADFLTETLDDNQSVIYSNVEGAALKYIVAVTDTVKFSPLAVNAIAWLLASYISGPLNKNPKIKEASYRMFATELAKAKAADGNTSKQQSLYEDFVPSSIAARQ